MRIGWVAFVVVIFSGIFFVACPGELDPVALSSIRTDIFEPRCNFSACHGGENPVRGLDLQNDPFGTLVNIESEENPSVLRVVPGNPDASLLFQIIKGSVGATRQMPPNVTLPDEDVEKVRSWILAGALDD